MSGADDDIRAMVEEYRALVCVDPHDPSLVHVMREGKYNKGGSVCGERFNKSWYIPLVALNEGPQRWCRDCLDGIEEAGDDE